MCYCLSQTTQMKFQMLQHDLFSDLCLTEDTDIVSFMSIELVLFYQGFGRGGTCGAGLRKKTQNKSIADYQFYYVERNVSQNLS